MISEMALATGISNLTGKAAGLSLTEVVVTQALLLKFQKLTTILRNEPLIELKSSLEGIHPVTTFQKDASLYYGTGLCSPGQLSVALPFDVLGLVFMAERIRRALGMRTIYHFIADTHAISSGQFDKQKVADCACKTRDTIEKITENLKLERFEITLASDIDRSVEYQNILQRLGTTIHDYIRREIADIEYYRRYKGVTMKLGWALQASTTYSNSDERMFDKEYRERIGASFSFIYIKAGRTLNKLRPKAAPYIHTSGDARVLLQANEHVARKLYAAKETLEKSQYRGIKRHLARIVRLYEHLFESLGKLTLEEKIQLIIERVTH